MSHLGILCIDLLPRQSLREKLASAKCIKEEKVGSATELLFYSFRQEMLTSKTPKAAASQEDS